MLGEQLFAMWWTVGTFKPPVGYPRKLNFIAEQEIVNVFFLFNIRGAALNYGEYIFCQTLPLTRLFC